MIFIHDSAEFEVQRGVSFGVSEDRLFLPVKLVQDSDKLAEKKTFLPLTFTFFHFRPKKRKILHALRVLLS